jgi:hypothetical protein
VRKAVNVSWQKYLPFLFVFLLGLSVDYALPKLVAFAHGGDTNKIHGCVKTNNGSLRIVGANDACGNNETALDWPATAGGGGGNGGGPLGYEWVGNGFYRFADAGINLDGHDFSNEYMSLFAFYNGSMVGANFTSAKMNNINFDHIDLSTAIFDGVTSSMITFTNSNLSGATFSNMTITDLGFYNTDVSNFSFTNSTVERADISSMDFSGIDLSTVTFGPESHWEDTTCPDGTDSDANGETCAGHLSP